MSNFDGLEQALAAESIDAPFAFKFLPDPEQLELLRDSQGRLPNNALQLLRKANHERGRGRPPGSQNKVSKKVAQLFFTRWGNPLDALGEIINTPTDLLCEQLELSQGGDAKHKPIRAIDAVHLRLKAIDIALQYLIAKPRVAIDLNARADVILNIPGLTDPAHLAEFVDDQELSEGELERIEYTSFTPAESASDD
jgi:hypothetical protein